MIQASVDLFQASLAASPHSQAFSAQLLSSSIPNAAYWLRSTSLPAYGTGVSFSGEDFLEMLRNRLLVPFTTLHGPGQTFCTCSDHGRVDLRAFPMHPLICSHNKAITIARHDTVRDRLATLLHSVLPDGRVRTEPDQHEGVLLTRRPDLYYEMNGQAHYLDIVIAEPTAAVYLNHPAMSSSTFPCAAAMQSEQRKLLEYANAAQNIMIQPFAIESTGRIGPAAKALLDHVCRDKPQEVQAFLFDLSFILASAKGRLLATCRRRLLNRDR